MTRPTTLFAAGPITLLALLGLPAEPARLDEAVLLVVDAQGEYRSGPLALDGIDAAASRLAALLARARKAGTPVIHIVQQGAPGGLFDPAAPRGAILPEAAPAQGEPVVAKPMPDAFVGTDLAERLTATGRRKLIVAGFQTHLCVDATVRDAAARGYAVTVAADATATRSLPAPGQSAPLAAASVQVSALAALADAFATVAPSDAIR
jgi:nicotinamidase-related amidase